MALLPCLVHTFARVEAGSGEGGSTKDGAKNLAVVHTKTQDDARTKSISIISTGSEDFCQRMSALFY